MDNENNANNKGRWAKKKERARKNRIVIRLTNVS